MVGGWPQFWASEWFGLTGWFHVLTAFCKKYQLVYFDDAGQWGAWKRKHGPLIQQTRNKSKQKKQQTATTPLAKKHQENTSSSTPFSLSYTCFWQLRPFSTGPHLLGAQKAPQGPNPSATVVAGRRAPCCDTMLVRATRFWRRGVGEAEAETNAVVPVNRRKPSVI